MTVRDASCKHARPVGAARGAAALLFGCWTWMCLGVARAGFYTALVCQETSAVLHCPHDSVINVQSAFYGRKNSDVCPHLGETDGNQCINKYINETQGLKCSINQDVAEEGGTSYRRMGFFSSSSFCITEGFFMFRRQLHSRGRPSPGQKVVRQPSVLLRLRPPASGPLPHRVQVSGDHLQL